MNQQLHTPSHKPYDYDKVLQCFQAGDYQGMQSGTGLALNGKEWLSIQLKSRLNWKMVEHIWQLLNKPNTRKMKEGSV